MVTITHGAEETEKFAGELMKNRSANVICLYGELGAGKTTFVRGALKGLSIKAKVQSPTFTYERIYAGKKITVYHFDCYRISGEDDLLRHDLERTFADPNGVSIIEWAQNISKSLPENRIDIFMKYINENEREIRVQKPMTDSDVLSLIEEFHVPLHVRRHCTTVSNFAVSLGEKLIKNGIVLNLTLIRHAALLHDLVRVIDFRGFNPELFPDPFTAEDLVCWEELRKKYKGKHHAIVGADILEERGLYDIAQVVRNHRYSQINKGFQSWEEKIVYYADKRAKHDKIVPLMERLEDGRKRNLPDEPITKESRATEKKILALEKEILKAVE